MPWYGVFKIRPLNDKTNAAKNTVNFGLNPPSTVTVCALTPAQAPGIYCISSPLKIAAQNLP